MELYNVVKKRNKRTGQWEQILRQRANSYVQAWTNIIRAQFDPGATYTTILGTDGGVKYVVDHINNMNATAVYGDTSYGIIIGTSNQAVAVTDYRLVTPILHGSTSGKMLYGVTATTVPAGIGTKRYFRVYRGFENASGAAITVREQGLYVKCYDMDVGGIAYLCIERSLVDIICDYGYEYSFELEVWLKI